MSSFLKLLQMELDLLEPEDFHEPDANIENHENIAGELTEELMRLWTVWRETEKSSLEKAIEAKYGKLSSSQRLDLLMKAKELKNKSELLEELFWIEVRDEYNLWDKYNVGIRKGRKIVWYKGEPPKIIGFGFEEE